MELTADLTRIQSIITECERRVGDLSNIRQESGHKGTLDLIINALKHFLVSQNYISQSNDIVASNDQHVKDIILFLMLNIGYDDELVLAGIEEYAHLINIMPKLSKFLVIHVAIELNLIDAYSIVAISLPTPLIPELFENVNDVLAGRAANAVLQCVKVVVRCLIAKVNESNIENNKICTAVQNINKHIGVLLMNLRSMSLPATAAETAGAIHIAYTLLTLLKFMLQVNEENAACARIVDVLILTTSTVLQQVTVQIYCEWVEVQEENMPLQYLIGTEAYRVIERYTSFKPAAQLLSLLSCMAKKPKTLTEIISGACLEDIITNIEYADANQRQWFRALLNKSIFREEIAMNCLRKWSTLCTPNDVTRLLNQAINEHDDCKHLAISCAQHLNSAEISGITARLFWAYETWKPYTLNSDVEEPLTLLLNRIDHQEGIGEAAIKDIQLLLLQQPQKVVAKLFEQCMKSELFLHSLTPLFRALKATMNLNNVPLDILRTMFEQGDFSDGSRTNLATLFNGLLSAECANMNRLFTVVVKPLCIGFQQAQDVAKLDFTLKMLETLPVTELCDEMKEELAIFLLQLLNTHRVKYTEFSSHKIGICTACINIIRMFSSHLQDFSGIAALYQTNELSKMTSYYLTLENETSSPSFLHYVFSSFATDNYGQMISKLIKISSRCTLSEWLLITEDLAANLGMEKALEALTDSIILICEVTRTQTSEHLSVYAALSFYLANYGICIQSMRERDSSQQFEVCVIKRVCHLIKMIPTSIKFQEGLGLISLLNEEALKSLSGDKQFIRSLVHLEDSKLSQIIAKKMLN